MCTAITPATEMTFSRKSLSSSGKPGRDSAGNRGSVPGCTGSLRRNRHQTVYLEPGLFSDSLRDESDTIEKEEKLATLYAAIRRLSELERAMIMLYLEDKTYEEMEEILGVNQNSLRVKMNRAKEKLRRLTKPS